MTNNFGGAWTALVTPMKDSGEVDYDGFRRLIEFQITEGIDGIVPLGSTGEAPTLEDDEEDKLVEIAVKTAGGKIPVMVGAGSNNTKHMIQYVRRAKDMGADAALVVTPYYNKPNDSGLIRHFEEAAKIGLPIFVYNIASRTGRNIPAPLMKKIAQIPGIAGVKESSGDINQMGDNITEIAAPKSAKGEKFWMLSGDDAIALPLISLGGDGLISVISNLFPAKVKAMVKAALEGDYEKARAVHYELLPFVKAAFIETNPVPIKFALNLAGLPAGPARLPLGEISSANVEIVKKAMAGLGVKF